MRPGDVISPGMRKCVISHPRGRDFRRPRTAARQGAAVARMRFSPRPGGAGPRTARDATEPAWPGTLSVIPPRSGSESRSLRRGLREARASRFLVSREVFQRPRPCVRATDLESLRRQRRLGISRGFEAIFRGSVGFEEDDSGSPREETYVPREETRLKGQALGLKAPGPRPPSRRRRSAPR